MLNKMQVFSNNYTMHSCSAKARYGRKEPPNNETGKLMYPKTKMEVEKYGRRNQATHPKSKFQTPPPQQEPNNVLFCH
jgi:hypothetical protein